MILIRLAAALALTLTLATGPAIAADEPDELMPGRMVLIRNGALAKFVAKAPVAFDLPDATNDPIIQGGSLTISDDGGSATDTFPLPAGAAWRALGNPPGSKGYKYRGAGSVSDPCRVVLVKQKVVKAVCKGAGVQLPTPFDGDVRIVLTVGTDSKNYCALFGGTTVRNDGTLLKAKSAGPPASCAPVATTTTTPTFTTTTNTGGSSTSTSSTTSTTIGGLCCGGMQYSSFISDGVNADTCGTARSANGSEYTSIACGGMYIGGGGNSITLPLSTPNNLHWVVELTNCTGQTATVGPTTSTDTQSNLICTKAPECFFGGPLTIPNHATPPASACVIINVASDASGTMNCSSGEAQIDLPLTADIFLTGDGLPLVPGLQPCPLCTGGQVGVEGSGICEGGTNNGMACTPANTDINGVNGMDPSYPTSHDCPPLVSAGIGAIPIGLKLDTGTISWTGTRADNPSSDVQTRVFCGYCRNPDTTGFESPFQQCWENGPVGDPCEAPNDVCQQRTQGGFGPNGAGVKTITVVGSAAGSIVDGLPHAQTLASVFCIPPTGNAISDAGADLPGPAAIPLKGTRTLCSTANNCPP
jgi:hypothetical protein